MWKLNPAMRLRCPSPSERIECRRSNRTAAYLRRKIMTTYHYDDCDGSPALSAAAASSSTEVSPA